jgi:hypothetical protein
MVFSFKDLRSVRPNVKLNNFKFSSDERDSR